MLARSKVCPLFFKLVIGGVAACAALRAAGVTVRGSALIRAETKGAGRKSSSSLHATKGKWGDQKDGTYANPVMPGDFSDLDAIRVGTTYYAISSTFQYSPGMVVLESADLVNWRITGHVVEDISRLSPHLNWDRMDRAGRGIWAGSIRYREGRYRVYFGTPDEGLFLSTATRAAGPWTAPVRVLDAEGWDDPCPFWDDDGKGYLVATHFKAEADGSTYNIHLFRLSDDGDRLLPGFDRTIHRSKGSEANKLYKIDGWYFHLYSEVAPEGRVVRMDRARSLDGPWETRQLIHVKAAIDKEPNQGGLIQLPDGRWYFVSHQGTGDWEGRAGVLLPVTWIDGWPILGRPGPDGIGNMVWAGDKPIPGHGSAELVTGDDFDERQLKPQWEWDYQPRADMWSLSVRPGFLRLSASQPLRSGDLLSSADILTQRSLRTRKNVVTVKFDLSGLVDGQEAALAHFSRTFAMLGVIQRGSTRVLTYRRNGRVASGPAIGQASLWIRSAWGLDGASQFSFSLDGTTFTNFGEPYQLAWGNYRGDRVALVTSNAGGKGGYLDVDSFGYEVAQ